MTCIYSLLSGGSSCGSERHDAAKAEHRRVADALTGVVRVHDPAAWREEVLKVRLEGPPGRCLDLVGDFDEGLGRTHWTEAAAEEVGSLVQRDRTSADLGEPEADAEGVVIAVW